MVIISIIVRIISICIYPYICIYNFLEVTKIIAVTAKVIGCIYGWILVNGIDNIITGNKMITSNR